jgi:hypothetical protein
MDDDRQSKNVKDPTELVTEANFGGDSELSSPAGVISARSHETIPIH